MKSIFSIITVAILLSGCEKAIFESDLEDESPATNFDYFWNQVNNNYAYFDLKKVDWDLEKAKYEALVYEGMGDDSLFNVMSKMLDELNDGHNNLISHFNKSYSYVIYSGNDNYDRRIVYDNYTSDTEHQTGPFRHSFLANGQIGYMRFDEFTGTVDDDNLDIILQRFDNTKGLIIDIRENRGGSPLDIFNILKRFVEEETLLYYSRYKISGPDRNAFSEPSPTYLQASERTRYSNKVIVLADRETYSAGSFFSLATKALPKVTLIGDTTGGGLGLPNGGQLPNGWTYRFSTTQALNLDKSPDWENGVPPDIFVEFDWNDRTKDEIIERAIEELLP